MECQESLYIVYIPFLPLELPLYEKKIKLSSQEKISEFLKSIDLEKEEDLLLCVSQ